MQTVRFGNADFDVTRLCLGTWNMSGQEGWGPDKEDTAIRLIHHALDSGCNFVDTARAYGRSEKVVGKALKGRRQDVILASKAMHCAPKALVENIDTSLRNLQTDCIDLYICHWPSPSHSLDDFFVEMVRQKEAGKIRAIGVSNFDANQLTTALKHGAVSLQPPFSILYRFADDTFDLCRRENVAVTPYSPLAQGLLTGRFSRTQEKPTGPRESNLLFEEPVFSKAREVAGEVDRLADKMGCTSSQVALAWVLQTPGILSCTVGASRVEQWDMNLGALDIQLAPEDYERLDSIGRDVWNQMEQKDAMWGWKPS